MVGITRYRSHSIEMRSRIAETVGPGRQPIGASQPVRPGYLPPLCSKSTRLCVPDALEPCCCPASRCTARDTARSARGGWRPAGTAPRRCPGGDPCRGCPLQPVRRRRAWSTGGVGGGSGEIDSAWPASDQDTAHRRRRGDRLTLRGSRSRAVNPAPCGSTPANPDILATISAGSVHACSAVVRRCLLGSGRAYLMPVAGEPRSLRRLALRPALRQSPSAYSSSIAVAPGDGSAVVSWVALADVGGAPVSGYTVTARRPTRARRWPTRTCRCTAPW